MQRILKSSLLTILFVGVLIASVELETLRQALVNLNLSVIVKSLLLVLFNQLIRAIRFKILLARQHRLNPLLILKITCIHQFLNHVLPMRSGEMSFPLLLERYAGSKYESSLACLILVRFYDALILFFCILIGFYTLVEESQLEVISFDQLPIILGGCTLVMLIIIFSRFVRRRRNKFPYIGQEAVEPCGKNDSVSSFWDRVSKKIYRFSVRVYGELRSYGKVGIHLKMLLCSGLIWISLLSLFHIFLSAVELDVSWQGVILGSSLASLTQLLPINTLGSVGTLEAGWVLGFSLLGLDSSRVLIAGVSMHALVLAASGMYAGLGWASLSARRAKSISGK